MSLTTFHRGINLLDFGDFLSPEISVCSQKSEFSCWLYGLVRPSKLQLVNFLPQVIFKELSFFNSLEKLFPCLIRQTVKLFALSIADSMLPFRLDEFKDVLRGQVWHFLLHLVEELVLKKSLSWKWLLRLLYRLQFSFERFDFFNWRWESVDGLTNFALGCDINKLGEVDGVM